MLFAEIEDAVAELQNPKQLLGKRKEKRRNMQKRDLSGKHPDSIRQSSRNTEAYRNGFRCAGRYFSKGIKEESHARSAVPWNIQKPCIAGEMQEELSREKLEALRKTIAKLQQKQEAASTKPVHAT